MADYDDDRQSNDSAVGAGDIARLVPAAILLVLLTLFVLANTQEVEVDFLFTSTDAPLIIVLLATAVIGAILVGLIKFRRRHS